MKGNRRDEITFVEARASSERARGQTDSAGDNRGGGMGSMLLSVERRDTESSPKVSSRAAEIMARKKAREEAAAKKRAEKMEELERHKRDQAEAKARAEGGAGEAGATGEAEKKQQEEEGDDGDAGGADIQAEALRRRDSRRQSLRLTRVEEAKALDEPANNNVRAVWMARLQHAEQVHWQMFPGASDAMRQASDAKDNESSTSGHDIYNNDDSTIYTDTGG